MSSSDSAYTIYSRDMPHTQSPNTPTPPRLEQPKPAYPLKLSNAQHPQIPNPTHSCNSEKIVLLYSQRRRHSSVLSCLHLFLQDKVRHTQAQEVATSGFLLGCHDAKSGICLPAPAGCSDMRSGGGPCFSVFGAWQLRWKSGRVLSPQLKGPQNLISSNTKFPGLHVGLLGLLGRSTLKAEADVLGFVLLGCRFFVKGPPVSGFTLVLGGRGFQWGRLPT